jgi:hypothetical protein
VGPRPHQDHVERRLLLDEVKDTGEGVAPAPASRVRELFDLTDRVSELLKEVQGGK